LAEATLLVTGGRVAEEPVVHHLDPDALSAGRVRTGPEASGLAVVGCGTVAPGHAVEIRHPDHHCVQPDGAVGEVWISGPSVTDGYWEDPDATATTFPEEDGTRWLRTGDLGAVVDGELLITGRATDVIIVRGRNLYPQDLEHSVGGSHPDISSAGSAAFAIDDAGSVVVAQEVPPKADRAEVATAIRAAVSRDHGIALADVWLVGPGKVPRTTSGKVRRRAARAAYEVRHDATEVGLDVR
jgi:acyl-CoA synthetase (AMP-forming)/AMP-acid ligase II